MAILALDDNTLLDAATHGATAGVILTNRSASGSIELTLPDPANVGDSFEIHQVEPYAITVQGQSAGDNVLGDGQSITLDAPGKASRLTYTGPHFWSGFISA